MSYYKIIVDTSIIGVCTSANCLSFETKYASLGRATDEQAEYMECKDHLYHALWMQPVKTNLYPYTMANIISIGEQEYNALVPASTPIPVEEDEIIPEPVIPVNPIDELTLEYVRTTKISEMSYACRTTIEAGFDLELRGEMHHFSLDTQDQLNLISLSAMAQTQSLIPYHADGEACIFYTSEEIGEIVETATAFKIYHTTYYNALKGYINALDSIEAISAITYGTEIPEEYKSDVLRALEQ